jgi:hypothetical protein
MVSGFITQNIKALTPKSKWIRAAADDGSAHLRKQKLRDGGEHLGETISSLPSNWYYKENAPNNNSYHHSTVSRCPSNGATHSL